MSDKTSVSICCLIFAGLIALNGQEGWFLFLIIGLALSYDKE